MSQVGCTLEFSLGLLETIPGQQFSASFPEVLTIHTGTFATLLGSFHKPVINYIFNIPLCQSAGFLLLFSTLKNILTQGQSSLSCSRLPFKSSFADYILILKSVTKNCRTKSVGPGGHLLSAQHLPHCTALNILTCLLPWAPVC